MIGPALLHSVSYAGLWGQAFLPVEDVPRQGGRPGLPGRDADGEAPARLGLGLRTKERARLRARLEKNDLQTVCIAGYTNFTADLEHADIPHREIQVQYVTELARLARDLGGRLVRVFTGYEATSHSHSRSGISSSPLSRNARSAPRNTT